MSLLDDPDLNPFLMRLTARSLLSEEERQAILALPAKYVGVPARRDFIEINEDNPYCFVVASGLIGEFQQTRSGTRQTTALYLPGDMIGLSSVVRDTGSGGLHAMCQASMFRIPLRAIRNLAILYPAIAEAFWRDCALDSAIQKQWLLNVGRRGGKMRIAHLLCELSVRSGGDRKATFDYDLPLTQEQLADAVAMTGVHVNRSLRELREDGILTFRSGRVQIHDWKKLAATGEFDFDYLSANLAWQERLSQRAPV